MNAVRALLALLLVTTATAFAGTPHHPANEANIAFRLSHTAPEMTDYADEINELMQVSDSMPVSTYRCLYYSTDG